MTSKILSLALASLALLLLSNGCASNSYPRVPASASGSTTYIKTGTVVNARTVTVDGQKTNVGVYGGAVVGSAVGSTVGRGDGKVLASAGGAVVGMIVGPMIEKALTSKIAQEVTIELDDGRVIAIVQQTRDLEFHTGDRVQVMESRGGSHITHIGI